MFKLSYFKHITQKPSFLKNFIRLGKMERKGIRGWSARWWKDLVTVVIFGTPKSCSETFILEKAYCIYKVVTLTPTCIINPSIAVHSPSSLSGYITLVFLFCFLQTSSCKAVLTNQSIFFDLTFQFPKKGTGAALRVRSKQERQHLDICISGWREQVKSWAGGSLSSKSGWTNFQIQRPGDVQRKTR